MAGRILDRSALREQPDRVEQIEAPVSDRAVVAAPPKKQRKLKTPAAPKVRTPRAKKTPPRMRALGCLRRGDETSRDLRL